MHSVYNTGNTVPKEKSISQELCWFHACFPAGKAVMQPTITNMYRNLWDRETCTILPVGGAVINKWILANHYTYLQRSKTFYKLLFLSFGGFVSLLCTWHFAQTMSKSAPNYYLNLLLVSSVDSTWVALTWGTNLEYNLGGANQPGFTECSLSDMRW